MDSRQAIMRVVSSDPASQGPFVIINASDFDESRHQLFTECAPADTPPHPLAKKRGRPPNAASNSPLMEPK